MSDLLDGKGVAYPAWSASSTYKSAPGVRPQEDQAAQQPLWPQDGGAGSGGALPPSFHPFCASLHTAHLSRRAPRAYRRPAVRRADPSSDGAAIQAEVAQRALYAARTLGTAYLPAVADHGHMQGVGVLLRM
jgi:hypothetical protein